jgi:hypothetical protein
MIYINGNAFNGSRRLQCHASKCRSPALFRFQYSIINGNAQNASSVEVNHQSKGEPGMKPPVVLFKKCSCGRRWRSREAFLSDPHVELTGYMADFETLKLGLLLFLHSKKECCTTLSIYADQVRDLYHGPIFKKRLTGGKHCPGICLREKTLTVCKEPCECAWVTVVLETIKKWKKIKSNEAG